MTEQSKNGARRDARQGTEGQKDKGVADAGNTQSGEQLAESGRHTNFASASPESNVNPPGAHYKSRS